MRIATVCLIAALCFPGCGPTTSNTSRNSSTKPDNSAVNKRDAKSSAVTPIDQNENQTDIKVTAEIRKALQSEPDMSINARNCKVVTANGKVTLRGPVESQAEKDTVARIAAKVAGADNVDNQLEAK